MTGNSCVVDTNIIIDSFNDGSEVFTVLDTMADIYVPVIVEAELLYGAYNSANPQKHILKVKSFLSNCRLLNVDGTTANVYATIKTSLRKKGRMIPDNDMWIAAIAIQHSLPMYTNDKHFKEIDNIKFL